MRDPGNEVGYKPDIIDNMNNEMILLLFAIKLVVRVNYGFHLGEPCYRFCRNRNMLQNTLWFDLCYRSDYPIIDKYRS